MTAESGASFYRDIPANATDVLDRVPRGRLLQSDFRDYNISKNPLLPYLSALAENPNIVGLAIWTRETNPNEPRYEILLSGQRKGLDLKRVREAGKTLSRQFGKRVQISYIRTQGDVEEFLDEYQTRKEDENGKSGLRRVIQFT